MSSSSGDLLPEMMESDTPPSAAPPDEAGEPEVSSRRVSPSPEGLKDLLERASISEEHHMLMNTMIGRISFTESGLYKAARSLLAGFEVREKMYLWIEPHI